MQITRNFFKIAACALLYGVALSGISLADGYYVDYDDPDYSPGGSDAISFFRWKLGGMKTNDSTSGFPSNNLNTGAAVNFKPNIIDNGFLGELSSTIMFPNKIAFDVGFGLHLYRVDQDVVNNIAAQYGAQRGKAERADLFAIPIHAAIQYHIAPYGSISPYVGVGYSAMVFWHNNSAFTLNSRFAHGPIFQIGCDIWYKDSTGISISLQKWIFNKELTYTTDFLGSATPISATQGMSPLALMVGISHAW